MNYPLYEAKKQIISILKEAISKLKYTCEIKLEIPPEEMGDFAFPCFQLAPIVKKSPIFSINCLELSAEAKTLIMSI